MPEQDDWTRRYLGDGRPLTAADAAAIIIKAVEQTGATRLPDGHRSHIRNVCEELALEVAGAPPAEASPWVKEVQNVARLRRDGLATAPTSASLAEVVCAMTQALRAVEWGLPHQVCCPSCGLAKYVLTDDGARLQGHALDCALDAALRIAGSHAAPAMIQLLLELEWVDIGEASLVCWICGGHKHETMGIVDPAPVHVGHTADCRLLAVLREAGVR